MVDSVQVEVSSEVLLVIEVVTRTFRRLTPSFGESTGEKLFSSDVNVSRLEQRRSSPSYLLNFDVHLQCTNCNLFITCDNLGECKFLS